MNQTLKTQLNYMLADTIWSQISGKSSRGVVFSRGESSQGYDQWHDALKKIDFKWSPSRVKDAAGYFLNLYQKMGQKILDDPSFILDHENPERNWKQLQSPEALEVRAIGDVIHQMVEIDPSLKQNLQEYLEKQIKEQIEKGNKALEIGYLFAKEPFPPEIRAHMKYLFDSGKFYDELTPYAKKAIVTLTDEPELEDKLKGKNNAENHSAIKHLYLEEPEQTGYRLKKVVEEELESREIQERERFEQEKREQEAMEERWQQDIRNDLDNYKAFADDFDNDHQPDPPVLISEEYLHSYFKNALHTLQEEELEKNPAQYAERLIKMQLLESLGLISDQEALDAFKKKKNQLFSPSPNEPLLEALAEKKAQLCQQRAGIGSEETLSERAINPTLKEDKKVALGAIDHQLRALELMTKGSRAYELIEANDRPAYPLSQKGLQEYQSDQSEKKQDSKIDLLQDVHDYLLGTLAEDDPLRHARITDEGIIQTGAFIQAFVNLDCPAKDAQKNYGISSELQGPLMDGIKGNLKHLVEEKKEEKKQEQSQERLLRKNEQNFDRHISEDDLDVELSPLNVDLALTVNKLATSVRKGIFGGKKDNSQEYDDMVQTLAKLLEDPAYTEPTLTQKENMECAYEICQDYVTSHKNAKTAEGKHRLDLVKDSMKILEDMNPKLKEKNIAAQRGERISFRDLEREEGYSRSRPTNARTEPQMEKTFKKERTLRK